MAGKRPKKPTGGGASPGGTGSPVAAGGAADPASGGAAGQPLSPAKVYSGELPGEVDATLSLYQEEMNGIPVRDRCKRETFEPEIAPESPLGKYVASEMKGVLSLAGADILAGPLEEMGALDLGVLGGAFHGGLVAAAGGTPSTPALVALWREVRRTAAFKAAGGLPISIAMLTRVCTRMAAAAVTSDAERVDFVRSAAKVTALAEVTPERARLSDRFAAVGDDQTAAGLAAEQAAVANRAEALKLTGVLAKLSKELDSRSKREEREQRKAPDALTVGEVTSRQVKAQCQGAVPYATQVPTEADRHTCFLALQSDPPRLATLNSLELPVDGRTKYRATASGATRTGKVFRHTRGATVEGEYALFERYMLAHGYAASSPSGPQYSEISDFGGLKYESTCPLFVYSRVGAFDEGGGDDGAELGGADAAPPAPPTCVVVPIIGAIVPTLLFTMACRSAGVAAGLSARAAQAHVTRILRELDACLYETRTDLTVACSTVEKMRLAGTGKRRDADPDDYDDDEDDDDDDDDDDEPPSRKRKRTKKDSAGKSRPSPAKKTAKTAICHKWACNAKVGGKKNPGCPHPGKECSRRHWWVDAGEKKSFKGGK